MAKDETYEVDITSAVVLDGEIVTAGRTVRVDDKTARNLLHRGKARLAAGVPAPARGDGPIGTDGRGGAVRQGAAVPADEPDAAAPLSEHTVAELREIAGEYGIEGASGMRKAELIEAIEAAEEEDQGGEG